jgi:CRISPR-associated protein Cas2
MNKMYFVVAYDITDDRRRNRVAKALLNFGQRMQYSVFECDIQKQHYVRMKDQLEKIINAEEDSVFFYNLCQHCAKQMERIGIEKKILDKEDYIV